MLCRWQEWDGDLFGEGTLEFVFGFRWVFLFGVTRAKIPVMLERCGYQVVSTLECFEGKTEALEQLELWWFCTQTRKIVMRHVYLPVVAVALKNTALLQA